MTTLRKLTTNDVQDLLKWENDEVLQRLTLTPYNQLSEFDILSFFVENGGGRKCFGICQDSDDTLIGYTYLRDIDYDNRRAFIGKVIIGNKDYRDGTCVFEAVSKLLEYGFCDLNLNRIEGACVEDHFFTPYMLQSFGFQKEGTFRQYIYKNGRYHNVMWYSLLRKDYNILKEKGEYKIGKLVKRCVKLIKA